MRPLLLGLVLVAGCQQAASPPEEAATPAPEPLPAPAPVAPRPAVPVAAPRQDPTKEYEARVKALHDAAEKGRVSLLASVVKGGADVNDKDDAGQTALHKAAAAGHKTVVVLLLALGGDLSEKDKKGLTPLLIAAEAGNAEIVRLLVSPHRVSELAGEALKSAGGLKGVDKLFDRISGGQSEVYSQADKSGQTAWHKAAAGGHTEVVTALWATSGTHVTAGAELTRTDNQGKTPVMLAAAGGHAAALEVMGRFSDGLAKACKKPGPDGKSPLEVAEAGGHKAAVKVLHRSAALHAAAEGDAKAVEAAFAALGAEFPAPAAMSVAAEHGRLGVIQALKDKWKDRPADEKRALMEGERDRNRPALFSAVFKHSPTTVKALLDKDWWKDAEALKEYITAKRDNTMILDGYYVQNYPQAVEAMRAVLAELDAKKK